MQTPSPLPRRCLDEVAMWSCVWPKGGFFFFFLQLTGFPPGFGVSEIGVYHENDPQKKKFFLPEKAVVARFERASLADTGREAKRAGGCYKNFFWEGLKEQKGRREIHSLPVEVSLPLVVSPRQPWEGSPS